MLLGEPPRTAYDLNFSLLGIPVRVHPLFWLVTVMLGYKASDPATVLTWIIAVFLSILVHELGHAAAMRAFGLQPWIILYGMGGLTSYDQGYASHGKGSEPLGQSLICLAGPVAGFLLAAVLILGLVLSGYGEISLSDLPPVVFALPNGRLGFLIDRILFISVVWGLVNLLPIYPLDGGQIAREILLKFNPSDGIRQSLWLSIFAAVGMAAYGFLQWQSWFVALFFGYLAYTSYATLEAYRNRNPW